MKIKMEVTFSQDDLLTLCAAALEETPVPCKGRFELRMAPSYMTGVIATFIPVEEDEQEAIDKAAEEREALSRSAGKVLPVAAEEVSF